MILTPKALRNLRKNRKIYTLIAIELGMTEGNVRRIANDNEPNNDLTKFSAVNVIKQNTGLKEVEILK